MLKSFISSLVAKHMSKKLNDLVIKEEDITELLKQIRISLLDADVNLLVVKDFIKNIQTTGASSNTGKATITVVNIQKFSKESIVKKSDYAVNVQRIYFLDEAHRSYKPTGSFLANLLSSDRDAVMIALTGTPLIGTIYDDAGRPVSGSKYDSKAVFGNYIHKYYYNRSIADGYTLKLIREGISTTYRKKMQEALESIEMLKGSLQRKDMYAHPTYVTPLVEYITDDFRKSRIAINDDTIGGMIVCDSSDQAKVVFEKMQNTGFSSALILHDVDDKETRQGYVTAFKKGTIDFLIVYNMLLTGFDAPRLKKLYLGRVIKDHNLLQALTRVNRPYKGYRYGYVVDFAKELLNLDVITNFQVIKFLNPIIPEDTVELTLKYNETKQALDFEYYLKNQEKVASKGKAKVSCNSNLA